MKMIKPIVNIAKVIDAYDAVICGFNAAIKFPAKDPTTELTDIAMPRAALTTGPIKILSKIV